MWSKLWNRVRIMATVQIVLDKELLQAADVAARRAKLNRSALVREALREHLMKLELCAKQEQDCQGYLRQPQSLDEVRLWEAEAVWPPE
jgi:metal-responsive CopG/Arc/MetJ family transcriptional regulator